MRILKEVGCSYAMTMAASLLRVFSMLVNFSRGRLRHQQNYQTILMFMCWTLTNFVILPWQRLMILYETGMINDPSVNFGDTNKVSAEHVDDF